jgi:hypothetical protein
MRLDALLNFVQPGAPLSLVGSAGVAIPSTNTIDLLGVGSGNASSNIIGNVTTFGSDTGVGGYKNPEIQINIGTALVTATSATLNVAFQGAPDNGSNAPGTWQTFAETGPITAAQGTAGQIIRMDWPVAFPANEQPRFVRLLFQVPAGADFTAGTVSSALVVPARDDWNERNAARNYVVA